MVQNLKCQQIKMNILVTGCAGFIGYHLVNNIANNYKENNIKKKVFGIDNLNNYYDVNLKLLRLKKLKKNVNFKFFKYDICNKNKLFKIIKENNIKIIIHLAAQAGVRHSIKNPQQYFDNNIVGFFNILEACKEFKINHLISASTSSVYGTSKKFPTDEEHSTDNPDSFYAASKKCNEILAVSYSKIYQLRITILRFFTVYGPLGRPDMALFKFVKNIQTNKKIELYNNGFHERDFTFIDDVIYSIIKIINSKKKKNLFEILNVAGSKPVKLSKFVKIIEDNLKQVSKKKYIKMQRGDVYKSHADNRKLKKTIGKYNFTKIEKGIEEFILWYNEYKNHKIND